MSDKFLFDLLKTSHDQLAVYVHLPWCISKCPYCDFNSHKLPDVNLFEQYGRSILDDINATDLSAYSSISSIFFGGGTPSLFPASIIQEIIVKLSQKLPFSDSIEITLEANPGSSDYKNFQGYFEAGVNRLSIGAQTFSDNNLAVLGRAHLSADIYEAIDCARKVGFENLNIDIMHGLPGQSHEQALYDLSQAVALGLEHISWYQLTIEPNTAFANSPPKLPAPGIRADIQDAGLSYLLSNGFERVEVSAFAKPGYASQHNMHVWAFNDYVGFGAGAHSKLHGIRSYRHYHPKQYMKMTEKVARHSLIDNTELLFEYMLNRARIMRRLDLAHILAVVNCSRLDLELLFADFVSDGLIVFHPDSLEITAFGIDHLDNIVQQCVQI